MPTVKAQISNQIQISGLKQKMTKNCLTFACLREAASAKAGILKFIWHLKFDIWISMI
jgi:hypothetical protein